MYIVCKNNTKKKRRCKKRTAHTQKCWIHLAYQDNLRVKPSTIPNAGKGLFSYKKSFPKNTLISNYEDIVVSKKAIDRKYDKDAAQYALCHLNRCVDANYTTDNAARLANDARKTPYINNAILTHNRCKFQIRAKTNINPYQEILTSYGKSYWNKKS